MRCFHPASRVPSSFVLAVFQSVSVYIRYGASVAVFAVFSAGMSSDSLEDLREAPVTRGNFTAAPT